ncbi:MAG: cell filamentation protein Fic [Planctomycetes bacterium]|nr:cell filamentation protein Fic [Planctomycetota bacterium]
MSGPVLYHAGDFPPRSIDWERLLPLIGPATEAVARYDGLLRGLPNAAVLLTPLSTQEAVMSSRIEGTQATMGEVLEFEADAEGSEFPEEKRNDIEEIANYRRAMRFAELRMQDLPLCQRLMKEVHSVLLEGVRGSNKAPGEYRRVPNWIGPDGCAIEEARYVPIDAAGLPGAMDEWENYLHAEAPDRLVQLGILHAEFEAIHPFLDGNGRLGRILIPLFLARRGLLTAPMLYISAYFERHRDEYYERLLSISRDRDWVPWLEFFLRSVREQAEENQEKADAIRQLYDQTSRRIGEITRSHFAVPATDFLFARPVFRAPDFYRAEGMTQSSGRRILGLLQDAGFFRIVRQGRGRRPTVLAYRELLNLAEGRNVF